MPEMAHTREYHCQAQVIAGGDGDLIGQRAAGLDYCPSPPPPKQNRGGLSMAR